MSSHEEDKTEEALSFGEWREEQNPQAQLSFTPDTATFPKNCTSGSTCTILRECCCIWRKRKLCLRVLFLPPFAKAKSLLGFIFFVRTHSGSWLSTQMQKSTKAPGLCTTAPHTVPTLSFKTLWAEAKAASKDGRWFKAEEILHKIRHESSEIQYITSANRSLAWLYDKWNWALLAQRPTNMKIVRRNLWSWLKLDNEKNSSPFDHMLLQAKILAGKVFLKMHSFLKLWVSDASVNFHFDATRSFHLKIGKIK